MRKLTIEQKNRLIGQKFDGFTLFSPIEDINGESFLSEEEADGCTNESFMWVKNLPEAEYIPPAFTILQ